MSEMVERVARAIETHLSDQSCFRKCDIDFAISSGEIARIVRAAIEEMREPTQAMLEASWRDTRDVKPDDRMAVLLMSTSMAHRVKTLNRWRAMIDAALKPSE